MRVLQVTTHMNMGGIANYVLSLSKVLRKRSVDCVIASSGGDMEEELRRNNIIHRPLDIRTKFEFGPKVLKSIRELKKIINEERIDIVHAHTRVSQVAGYFAARMADTPYITTCHGFFNKRLGRRLFDFWGGKVIAISGPVKESLVNDFGVKPERIKVIHNGVDVDRFLKAYSPGEIQDIKRALALKAVPVIGTIGRLSSVKGHVFFIEAFKDMLAKGRHAEGIIVGNGPEEEGLKKLVRRYGMEGSFHFFASDADTARYLAAMDVFVFPSVKEGLGLSLLEAMAAARPCVASRIGGISDIITDGENGILFSVGDTKALADSIMRLVDNDDMRMRFGESARRLVKERFSLDIMADRISNLYSEVISSYASG